MITLISILQSLRDHPRLLTDEENLYLDHLRDELRKAESDGIRWRILQREGLPQVEGWNLEDDVIAKLAGIRRASMN